MTDTAMPRQSSATRISTAEAVQRSLRRRYAAERRFRLYGLTSICAAILFLVLLLASIIANGHTAFVQSKVRLDIALDAAAVDPDGNRSPESLAKGDYRMVLRSAFASLFPEVTGRGEQRQLFALLSNGAPFNMADEVSADPGKVGTTAPMWIMLSAEADSFIKGQVTDIDTHDGQGSATPSGMTGAVRIASTTPEFAAILAEIKVDLTRQADATGHAIAASQRHLDTVQRQIAAGHGDAEALQQEAASLTADLTAARAKLADLEQRAKASGGTEAIDHTLPSYFIRINGGLIDVDKVSDTAVEGTALRPLESDAAAAPGSWEVLRLAVPEDSRRVGDLQAAWLLKLMERDLVETQFNTVLFTAGDSRDPEQAGVGGAIIGSFYALLVCLALSFPLGVMTAVYLEEFAPKNRWTDLIEVNINNLAAVPSIVFGLLGLAVFLNIFGLPRSAPLVGGLVLALMTLPTIIIASRAALKAVPPSIREAALGIGASRTQAITDHVLPLAMPGMLTGTIIGMAQALGETAPLLMIGMIAFIVQLPATPFDPATVLPVQIFLWADSPERAFVARTSAAILILLGFLVLMNLSAILLRKRFERRW